MIESDLQSSVQNGPNKYSDLLIPSYAMCLPFNIDTKDANNIWMEELTEKDRTVNKDKAIAQFLELYNYMSSESIVTLVPTVPGLQDQVFAANHGVILASEKQPTFIESNFKSQVRIGEEKIASDFLKMMGYKTYKPPFHFEGEAELKYINEKNYIGGYGVRSDKRSYDWMMDNFDINIIKLKMEDPYLYHMDCMVFPLNHETVMCCTELIEEETIDEIEQIAEIIDVSADDCYGGTTNSCRMYNLILNASSINSMKKTDKYYDDEIDRISNLTKICADYGLELVLFDLSEYMKSGALLSCMIMHLNYRDYMINGFTKKHQH